MYYRWLMIQTVTDKFVEKVEKIVQAKEKELK